MKASILVVDDEEVARKTLLKILQLEGYTVKAVANGILALGELKKNSFDVMLLDYKMPGMDGMEVLDHIYQTDEEMKVIMLTAFGTMDTVIKALRFRVADFIIKPASPEQILKSVQRVLDEKFENHELEIERKLLASSAKISSSVEGQFNLPGNIKVDCIKRTINAPQNEQIILSPSEARLIGSLLKNLDQVVSHVDLVFLTQGYQLDAEEAGKMLRPVMSRLRRKLACIKGSESWIRNIRGTGYMFTLEDDQ